MYKIRSPVNPAKAELSTKNSDSAFLLYFIFIFLLSKILEELLFFFAFS
jgi:hypothetical protein